MPAIYLDPSRPIQKRVADLISRMTLPEKVSQMQHDAPAIERLHVPAYNWWNECLHGIGRAGIATVFPQAIGLAATWNDKLMFQVATAISDEARAKHHQALRNGEHGAYQGLTFWSPNINLFRDPRWGRGQETYGEDPYLAAQMGVAFVKGLQGDDEHYLKAAATPKHFAVHSGPEKDRHHFNAQVSQKDLWESYLPAFEACVVEGKAASVMGAYNRLNGEPACASPTLLGDILRGKWGFDGYVVSDCGAIGDIYQHHQLAASAAEAAALAVQHGCDLECGETYAALTEAVDTGLLPEADIDLALTRLFTVRFKLGMFDPPQIVPYAQIPYSVNDCSAHQALALQAARESLVLLKNEGGVLPLSKELGAIAVIGPNADDGRVLLGNYHGTPSAPITPLAGIEAVVSPKTRVIYAQGCAMLGQGEEGFAEAIAAAERAEITIFVGGISQKLEGEEMMDDLFGAQAGQKEDDRSFLGLPRAQDKLLKRLAQTGKPIILILLNGSMVAVNWAQGRLPAILEAWYPGQAGGQAIAEALFGDYNPGGRLPITFYKSADDLPPFSDYDMANRTYRYFSGEPLYPFGFGLSYSKFAYSDIEIISKNDGSLQVAATVANVSHRDGDEVTQLYLRHLDPPIRAPQWRLIAFRRQHLRGGESKRVTFAAQSKQLCLVDDDGRLKSVSGTIELSVGGGLPGSDLPTIVAQFELPAS